MARSSSSASKLTILLQWAFPNRTIGAWGSLAGLLQRQHFEHFVQGAKTARKNGQGVGAHREMHFSHGKIVEAERQFRRNV